MITRVRLKNWRAYTMLDLELHEGTTFVIAPNGVGKTSIVEGVAWTLFGDAAIGARPDPIRVGSTDAEAEVEMRFPSGEYVRIRRNVALSRSGRISPSTVRVWKDTAELLSADLNALLRDGFGADPTFLWRLTIGGDVKAPAALPAGLQDHLCHYTGVDGLQTVLTTVTGQLKDLDRQIKSVKEADPASPRAIEDVRGAIERAQAELARRQTELTDLGVSLAAVEQARVAAAAHSEWLARRHAREESWLQIVEDLRSLTGESGTNIDLEQAVDDVNDEVETARSRAALLVGRIAVAQEAAQQLGEPGTDCPVCRRPLGDSDVTHARQIHEAEIRAWQHEAGEISAAGERARQRTSALQALLVRQRTLPILGEEPPSLPDVLDEESIAALRLHVQEVRSAAEVAEHEARRGQAALNAMLVDRRTHDQLTALYRKTGALEAAKVALQGAVEDLLHGTVRPLEQEISPRWCQLFAYRGSLQFDGPGRIVRNVAGRELPADTLSTGEAGALVLLTRLLILCMSTTASFCWFDEPLEHLDPQSRRNVASLLAQAATSSPLQQILVTTYEEPLARAVAERAPDQVRLIYVRPDEPAHESTS